MIKEIIITITALIIFVGITMFVTDKSEEGYKLKVENDYKIEQSKLILERQKLEFEKESAANKIYLEEKKQSDIKDCIALAESKYWANMELNATKNVNGVITAGTEVWDREERIKQDNINNCYLQYE